MQNRTPEDIVKETAKKGDIVKKYTFVKEDVDKLRNVEIGIINAQATNTGLNIFKDIILGKAYKNLGIDKDPQKGYSKSITYNLAHNEITHTESPIKKEENNNG